MADLNILDNVARQYRASLAMLGQVVHLCPECLWIDADYPNRFWHIAYHALFYTHLYLQPSEADFRPWAKHRQDSQYLGPRPWAPQETPQIQSPYTKVDAVGCRRQSCDCGPGTHGPHLPGRQPVCHIRGQPESQGPCA